LNKRIPYTLPSITALEQQYAADAVANGWGERCYDYINKFETAFAKYLGVKHAIATSSCTGALHMGLAALGIGQGDEVVLADTNWIATAAPIVHLGATPVFVDIREDSWCLDPELVSAAITPKTKAIVATHIYGNLVEMDALREVADNHGLPLIEDAAEALGSEYHGSKAGSMGRFGVFSFHGTKTITTGEGGMFVTNDPLLFERVLTLSNHGRSRTQSKQFWPDEIGYKFKMSNVQAAIGLAQIERIEELVLKKRQVFAWYKQGLSGVNSVVMNPEPPGTKNSYWMPTVVFDQSSGVTREILQESFKSQNIDARVFFWPLSLNPVFHLEECKSPRARDIAARAINVPSFFDMNADQALRIVDIVSDTLRRCSK
jgi:perosamine synthetase